MFRTKIINNFIELRELLSSAKVGDLSNVS